MPPREIPLRDRKKEVVAKAFVSEEDYEWVSKYTWYRNQKSWKVKSDDSEKIVYYAMRDTRVDGVKTKVYMHKEIIEKLKGKTPENMIVDHIDGNKLNNTRENLRFATQSANMQNRDSKEGVMRGVQPKDNKFQARSGGVNLGVHKDKIELGKAYDRYNLVVHGEGAKTNGLVKFEEVSGLTVDDVIPPKKVKELPVGIHMNGNRYVVELTVNKEPRKQYFPAHAYEKAICLLEEWKKERAEIEQRHAQEKEEILKNSIQRNSEGVAIIKVGDDEILVDEDKWVELMKFKWRKLDHNYATTIKRKTVTMNEYLMKDMPSSSNQVRIFRNGNKKDHRIVNLKYGSLSEAMQGRTGPSVKPINHDITYTGVFRHYDNRYVVYINGNYCGSYDCQMKAALAYNIKAQEMHGEDATLNELPEDFVRQNEEEVRDIMVNGPKKSSKFIGVTWQTHDKKWRASLQHNHKTVLCKQFDDEIEAAAAYNIVAMNYPEKNKLNEGIPQEVIDRVKIMMETPRQLTSKYLYVSWHKGGNSYRYTLPPGKFKNDKKIPLSKSGFKTDKEAAIACNQVIRDIKGDQSLTTIVIDDNE